MTIDYLSAINNKGSGMNITQLVDALVQAEVVPKRNLISKKQDATELSISELAKLRSAFDDFQTVLKTPNAGVASDAYSTSTAVSVRVSDYSALRVAKDLVSVDQLARGQVLEFSGFTSANAAVASGSLAIQFGTWSHGGFQASGTRADQTVSFAPPGGTLTALATKLDALDGVSARVVAKGVDNYSLVVVADPGVDNALRITASDPGLAAFDNSAANSQQVLSAQNARLTYNGIALERRSNSITDLVPGVVLDLNAVTQEPATVGVIEDASFAEGELAAYLEKLNGLIGAVKTATRRGVNGQSGGPLAGDVTMGAILRQLSSLTTTPIQGFGEEPVYLGSYGVQTERDGTFSIDSAKFAAAFAANPAGYRAIFANLAQSSDSAIGVTVSATADPPAGAHDLIYTNASTATLNGSALIPRAVNGRQTFYALTGAFKGISIDVTDASPGSSKLYFGQSAFDRMSDYITAILAKTGDFGRVETSFAETALSHDDALSDLAAKEELLADLYRTKFTVMEQQITRLKSTGTYLTNMVEAWKKE